MGCINSGRAAEQVTTTIHGHTEEPKVNENGVNDENVTTTAQSRENGVNDENVTTTAQSDENGGDLEAGISPNEGRFANVQIDGAKPKAIKAGEKRPVKWILQELNDKVGVFRSKNVDEDINDMNDINDMKQEMPSSKHEIPSSKHKLYEEIVGPVLKQDEILVISMDNMKCDGTDLCNLSHICWLGQRNEIILELSESFTLVGNKNLEETKGEFVEPIHNHGSLLPKNVSKMTIKAPKENKINFDHILWLLELLGFPEELNIIGFENLQAATMKIPDSRLSCLLLLSKKTTKIFNGIKTSKLRQFFVSPNDTYLFKEKMYGTQTDEFPKDLVAGYLDQCINVNGKDIKVFDYLDGQLKKWKSTLPRRLFFAQKDLPNKLKNSKTWHECMDLLQWYMTQPRVFLIACFKMMSEPNWDDLLGDLPSIALKTKEKLFVESFDVKIAVKSKLNIEFGVLAQFTTKVKFGLNKDLKSGCVEYIGQSLEVDNYLVLTLNSEDREEALFGKHKLAWKLIHEIIGHLVHLMLADNKARKNSFEYLNQESGHEACDLAIGGEMYEDWDSKIMYLQRSMGLRPDHVDVDYLTQNKKRVKSSTQYRVKYCIDIEKTMLPLISKIDKMVENGTAFTRQEDKDNLFWVNFAIKSRKQLNKLPAPRTHHSKSASMSSLSSSSEEFDPFIDGCTIDKFIRVYD